MSFGELKQYINYFIVESSNLNLPVALLIIIFGSISLYFLIQKIKEYLGITVSKKVVISNTDDLLNHDLFLYKNSYLRVALSSNFGDYINDKIFHIVLKNKVNSTIDFCKKFITSHNIQQKTLPELKSFLFTLDRMIVENYNINIKIDLMKEFGSIYGLDIYNYVMNDANKGFNVIHDNNITMLDNMVNDYICKESNINILSDNISRMYLYLTLLNVNLRTSITYAENMFYGFNGKLDTIKKALSETGYNDFREEY